MNALDLVAKITLDSSEYDSGLNAAASKASSIGGAIGKGVLAVGKAAAGAVTAATTAAAGFTAASVKTGMDFDSAMSQVAATMGTTTDQIVDLRDFAQEMGARTAFSATQAAEALNYMALAGYDSEESMSMLPNVLNLAAAGGMELATASDMITDAQTALGLTFEQTNEMVDQMAKTASTTNTSVSQLGDAILTVGGTASYMAGGTEQINAVLGVLADNGIKGSEAGTHLRNMLLKLASPTEDAVALLDELGVKAFDSEGKMRDFSEFFPELNAAMADLTEEEKLQAFSTIFNARDIASANALLSTTPERWKEISGAIDEAKGAAEQMAETQLDNLAGDITLFQSAMEGAKIIISDSVTPALRDFVQFGTDGVSRLGEAFREGGLSGAMSVMGELISEGLTMILESLPQWIEAGMTLLGALGQGLLDNLPVIIEAAVSIVNMLIEGITTAVPALIDGAIQILGALSAALIENIPLLIESGLEIVLGLANAIIDALPNLSEKAPEIIKSIVDGLVNAIPQLMEVGIDLIIALAKAISDPDTLFALVDGALEIMLAIMNGMIDAIPRLLDAVPKIISNLVTALVASVPKIVAAAAELIVGMITGFVRATPRIVAAIPALILAIVGGISRGISKIIDVGGDIVKGLWQGIKNRWSRLVDDFKGLASGLVSGIKGLFGIHSPSTVFAGIGRNIDEGLAQGINNNMGIVDEAMGSLEDYANGSFEANISAGGVSGYGVGNNITMNIYGAQGQDVRELADIVIQRLGFVQRREEAIYA